MGYLWHVAAAVRHGNHLGHRHRHANADDKRNIDGVHHQGSSRQVLVTDRADHGRIDEVQRHLRQFTNDDGHRQPDCFIGFRIFQAVEHSSKKSVKIN